MEDFQGAYAALASNSAAGPVAQQASEEFMKALKPFHDSLMKNMGSIMELTSAAQVTRFRRRQDALRQSPAGHEPCIQLSKSSK